MRYRFRVMCKVEAVEGDTMARIDDFCRKAIAKRLIYEALVQ